MQHPVVSQEEWLKARKAHLLREKEYTKQRDKLAAERRALPWVKVEKNYAFDTPAGRKSLSDLFDGRSQLIVQHFMFAPSWEAGCVGCSFGADHADSARQHFENHDVKYVAVARAPLAKLQAYKKRMGWQFDFVSSADSGFNFDYRVSFTPEEIARGKPNTTTRPSTTRWKNCPASASSTKTTRTRSSTPIRPTPAATRKSSAPSCGST